MDKKQLQTQYKNRIQTGGVYAVKNTVLDKWYVEAVPDLKSARNRFDMFGSTHRKVERDYQAQHGEGFVFEVLEELQKSETQTDGAFREDLKMLKEMWLEKLTGQKMY